MDHRIVARLVTPTVMAVQLGGLVTTLSWVFYGYLVGVSALIVSLISVCRALQTGFVVNREGLKMRPFLPFVGPPTIPWARLRSVDVDEVTVGTETRSRKLRIRFFVEGERAPLQVIGCRKATVSAVTERFRAHGLPATDQR